MENVICREPAARRPQLPRAGAAGARHRAGGARIGRFGARRFCVHRGWRREDSNGFLLDGAYNVDPKLNSAAVRPPVDAIREFEVLTSSYEPEIRALRRRPGERRLKSGTNSVHGTAYGFFRNGALDARNFFAPRDEPAPDYRRNQFGGSLGGPISRDRSFFFADYEGTRITEGITRVTNVPTAAERAGDFSRSVLPPPINFFTGQPFPGNQVPSFFQNPIGRAIAELYPRPNRNVAVRQLRVLAQSRGSQRPVRRPRRSAGWRPPDLSARYSFRTARCSSPSRASGFSLVPGFGNTLARRAQNLVASDVSVISPRLLNEARFGFTRVASQVIQEGQGISLNRQVGLPELSANPRDWGLSFITVTGYSPLGHEYNNPQKSITDTFQFVDTITWCRGAHLVKGGFDLRTVRQDAFRDVQSRGQLAFTGLHRQRPGRSAARPADDHRRRGARQPAAPAHRERRPVRAGQWRATAR